MNETADDVLPGMSVRICCPACGARGKPVRSVTLRSLLKDEFAEQVRGTGSEGCHTSSGSEAGGCRPAASETGWRFCESPGCDVVYFSECDDRQFTKSQLKVEVGIKETSGERPLCYCFGHSVESMKRELRRTGTCTALDDIRAKMKNSGCRCETENPSGSCCLGSVAHGLKIAQQELGMADEDMSPLPDASGAGSRASMTGRGEKIATAGTLISAVMASSCCWLPLLLLAAGVSGAGIASTLEAYRPGFMVLTFGFLGTAFWFAYRPKKTVTAGPDNCCSVQTADAENDGSGEPTLHDCCSGEPASSADCCAPTGGGRFRMMTLNRAMLWMAAILAIAFLFFPDYVGAFLGGDGTAVTQDMNRAVIAVDGMTCEGCAAGLAAAVRDVPGVLAVDVDYAKHQVVVGTEFCCPVPEKDILAAVHSAGFSGQVIRKIPAGESVRSAADR